MYAISTLSNFIAELSRCATWHMTCCMWWTPDMSHVICTRLHLAHLSVGVGDSLPCSEEIIKNLELCFSMWLLLLLLLLLLAEELWWQWGREGQTGYKFLAFSSWCLYPTLGKTAGHGWRRLHSDSWSRNWGSTLGIVLRWPWRLTDFWRCCLFVTFVCLLHWGIPKKKKKKKEKT